MSRGLRDSFLTLVNDETPNDIFLHLITVSWADNTYSRYVKNFEDVVSRGDTYKAGSFSIQLPEEPEDSIPTITVGFSATEEDIVHRIRNETSPPALKLELVLASDPDYVEVGPFDFDVRSVRVRGIEVNVEAGFEPILDLVIPQITYSPKAFPGLFKDFSQGT